jgi:feruloyl esterase
MKLHAAWIALPLLVACSGQGGGTIPATGARSAQPIQSPRSNASASALSVASEESCSDLKTAFQSPGVVITASDVRAATSGNAKTPALPQHCEITGAIDQRAGADNQTYAIKFHLRVPIGKAWSGRFVFGGGGGSNGEVGDALIVHGSLATPLAKGDAVLTQDSGHDNRTNVVPAKGGNRVFGFDPQARIDNFYRAQGRAAEVAKEIIQALSGNGPRYSYFAGCSKGGQEAAMVMQRYPDMFDGVVVGDPLLEAPIASMVRPAFIAQTFADLARKQNQFDRNGLPFVNKTFTDADLAVLKAGIAQQCDLLDGVKDGMSQDFQACTAAFKPSQLQCKAGQTSGCLTADQVTAIEKQMAGLPGDVPWYYDMGAIEGQYRSWWLGRYDAVQASNNWIGRAVSTIYTTPPVAVNSALHNGSEPYRFLLNFNFATDVAGIYRSNGAFTQSSWDISYATGTDLSKFTSHGGKVLIYHGVSDGSFPIQQTLDWVKKLNAANGGDASNFMRMYAVPGMGHCSGGPATSQFDMLAAVQDWVEKGKAPESILATAPAGTPWPGRTRPLCPYPKVARYVSGDIEKASNFACQ